MLTVGSWVRVKVTGCCDGVCLHCWRDTHNEFDNRVGKLVIDLTDSAYNWATCKFCLGDFTISEWIERTGHIYGVRFEGVGDLFSREEIEVLGDGSLDSAMADALARMDEDVEQEVEVAA